MSNTGGTVSSMMMVSLILGIVDVVVIVVVGIFDVDSIDGVIFGWLNVGRCKNSFRGFEVEGLRGFVTLGKIFNNGFFGVVVVEIIGLVSFTGEALMMGGTIFDGILIAGLVFKRVGTGGMTIGVVGKFWFVILEFVSKVWFVILEFASKDWFAILEFVSEGWFAILEFVSKDWFAILEFVSKDWFAILEFVSKDWFAILGFVSKDWFVILEFVRKDWFIMLEFVINGLRILENFDVLGLINFGLINEIGWTGFTRGFFNCCVIIFIVFEFNEGDEYFCNKVWIPKKKVDKLLLLTFGVGVFIGIVDWFKDDDKLVLLFKGMEGMEETLFDNDLLFIFDVKREDIGEDILEFDFEEDDADDEEAILLSLFNDRANEVKLIGNGNELVDSGELVFELDLELVFTEEDGWLTVVVFVITFERTVVGVIICGIGTVVGVVVILVKGILDTVVVVAFGRVETVSAAVVLTTTLERIGVCVIIRGVDEVVDTIVAAAIVEVVRVSVATVEVVVVVSVVSRVDGLIAAAAVVEVVTVSGIVVKVVVVVSVVSRVDGLIVAAAVKGAEVTTRFAVDELGIEIAVDALFIVVVVVVALALISVLVIISLELVVASVLVVIVVKFLLVFVLVVISIVLEEEEVLIFDVVELLGDIVGEVRFVNLDEFSLLLIFFSWIGLWVEELLPLFLLFSERIILVNEVVFSVETVVIFEESSFVWDNEDKDDIEDVEGFLLSTFFGWLLFSFLCFGEPSGVLLYI